MVLFEGSDGVAGFERVAGLSRAVSMIGNDLSSHYGSHELTRHTGGSSRHRLASTCRQIDTRVETDELKV